MSAVIVIPPNFWDKSVFVKFQLVDQFKHPFPAEITDSSGWVAGAQSFSIGSEGGTISIPCNDELPSPPGETPQVGSFWLVTVQETNHQPTYHVQISSASPPVNWNELIEAGTPVDPADIWSGRLGPADAVAGQYQQFDGLGWQAVDPPAGTGDVSGPASAVNGNLAVFDGVTGKIIKDGGAPSSGGGIPEAPQDLQIYGRKEADWSRITPAEIAAVPETRRVDGTQSIVDGGPLTGDLSLRLFGDVAAPGNNKLYGTDGAGSRGWYDQGIGDAIADGNLYARKNNNWITWTPSDVGAVPETRQVSGVQSVLGGGALTNNLTFSLLGDTATPGANKLYGTDGAGVKGWFDQPDGGAGSTNLGNIPSSTNVQVTSSSGTDTTVVAATITLAGVMSAAQVSQLSATATQAGLDAHTTDTGNPHTVTKAQVGLGSADNTSDAAKPISSATQAALDGKEAAGAAAVVQASLDTHTANLNNPHTTTKAHVGLGNADNTSDAAKPISSATQVALDGKIGAVIDDTTPELGGDLVAGGAGHRVISITDLTGTQVGVVGYSTGPNLGVALGYKTATEAFDPLNGGILGKAGQVILGGASITVDPLQHSQSEGYQALSVSQGGSIFAMAPPTPEWSISDTSNVQLDLTLGNTQGPWVLVSNLSAMPVQDVAGGDRLDIQINLRIENTESKTGNIIIGFGIDGVDPTDAGIPKDIPGNSDIVVPVSISSTTHGGITSAQIVNIFVRRGASTDNAHLYLRGDLQLHELFLSVPGGGSGSTDLSTTYTASTFTVQSSTGADALVAQATAGGNAGALSGADKTLIDASLQPSDIGVAIGDLITLVDAGGGTPGLPAVDGSQLTGLPGSGATNITITYTATTFTVVSDTGTDGTVAEAIAGGDAGALSGARASLIDSALQPSGSTLVNIGQTEQALGTVGGGTSVVDLSLGGVITATLSSAQIINFTNSPTVGYWTATINTQSNGVVWQAGGVAIDLPDGYDISGSPQRIEFSFVKTSLGVSVTERKIP